MTKKLIVQRLLDKKQITAEEAVILLEKEYSSYPVYVDRFPCTSPCTTPYWTSPVTYSVVNI